MVRFNEVTQRHNRVLIIAGGESLVRFDVAKTLQFDGVIITINNVVFHIPRADYWITVDPMWNGKPQRGMTEQKSCTYYFCAFPDLSKSPHDAPFYTSVNNVHYLERIVPMDNHKLQEDKNKITTGDSVYGALGLAYHFEAKEIHILGLDVYGSGHWYDKQSKYNAYNQTTEKFNTYKDNVVRLYRDCVEQFNAKGTNIYNYSINSRIDAFNRYDLLDFDKYALKK